MTTSGTLLSTKLHGVREEGKSACGELYASPLMGLNVSRFLQSAVMKAILEDLPVDIEPMGQS